MSREPNRLCKEVKMPNGWHPQKPGTKEIPGSTPKPTPKPPPPPKPRVPKPPPPPKRKNSTPATGILTDAGRISFAVQEATRLVLRSARGSRAPFDEFFQPRRLFVIR